MKTLLIAVTGDDGLASTVQDILPEIIETARGIWKGQKTTNIRSVGAQRVTGMSVRGLSTSIHRNGNCDCSTLPSALVIASFSAADHDAVARPARSESQQHSAAVGIPVGPCPDSAAGLDASCEGCLDGHRASRRRSRMSAVTGRPSSGCVGKASGMS